MLSDLLKITSCLSRNEKCVPYFFFNVLFLLEIKLNLYVQWGNDFKFNLTKVSICIF